MPIHRSGLAAFLTGGFVASVVLCTAGCESETATSYTSAPAPEITGPAPTEEALAEPNPEPAPQATNPDRLVDKTFDDLKFDIEPDAPFERSMLPDEIEQMVGQRIRIRGYILPTFQRSGIKQFVLVRDNQECCFGPGAALYDCIVVDMQPGNTADFSVKPVAVEGRFSIDELRGPDGNHLAVFHMDGEKVD